MAICTKKLHTSLLPKELSFVHPFPVLSSWSIGHVRLGHPINLWTLELQVAIPAGGLASLVPLDGHMTWWVEVFAPKVGECLLRT